MLFFAAPPLPWGTIIFASVLFFGGISGKFRWQVLDVAVLVFGALILFAGMVILLSSPIR